VSYTNVAAGGKIYASTINDLIRYGPNKPRVRLVASGTQSIPDATQTALTFSTEDVDPDGFHSTSSNTSRITPTVAGLYLFMGTYFTAGNTDYVTVDICVAKNGSGTSAPAERRNFSTTATQVSNALSVQCSSILEANGSTDYFELFVFQDSAGSKSTNQSQRFSSTFQCFFIGVV